MTRAARRYLRPGRFDGVFNRLVGGLTLLGLPVAGSRVLEVRGRRSGEVRTTPVNPLRLGGEVHLVSPRGHTQWVRNLRAAGEGRLRHGRRVVAFHAEELPDAEKTPILRAYLRAWGWEVGRFFDGVDAHASDERLAEIAPGFPVFRIRRTVAPAADG